MPQKHRQDKPSGAVALTDGERGGLAAREASTERVVKGLGVSPGIVIGTAMVVEGDDPRVPRRTIPAAQVASELAKLDKAVKAALDEVLAVHAQAEKEMGKETAKIFLAHAMMLRDSSLLKPMRGLIEKELVTADYASYLTLADLAAKFRAIGDSAFATKVNDIDDLAHRLHRHLVGGQRGALSKAPTNTIVVAKDLTPSQTAGFDRSKILGFATDLGGLTSHTAIIAKALEIPAVVGAQTLLRSCQDGDRVIVDGDTGTIVVQPTQATIAEYERVIEQRRTYRMSLTDVADLPAVTRDGTKVTLLGNIELPDEVERIFKAGGDGVGLYRTEYLWLTRNREPTEEEHFKAYKKCVDLCAGRELVIRTCDLGADKLPHAMEQHEDPERNPFLGNRSIRYCLRNVPMFKRQLRGILRASAFGPIKIMIPLVTAVHELRQAKFILKDVMEDLAEDRIKFDANVPVGMMVEVPSAAIQAETFAREVSFFSIGTNDLIQYTLAVDRINERVAHLYQATHPAVIKLIRDVARSARRHQTPVSCCGESAGDVEYAMCLLGLGLRTFSVSASSMPQLKRFVRSVTIEQCEAVARKVLTLDSDVLIAAYLRERARTIVPEAFSGRSAD